MEVIDLQDSSDDECDLIHSRTIDPTLSLESSITSSPVQTTTSSNISTTNSVINEQDDDSNNSFEKEEKEKDPETNNDFEELESSKSPEHSASKNEIVLPQEKIISYIICNSVFPRLEKDGWKMFVQENSVGESDLIEMICLPPHASESFRCKRGEEYFDSKEGLITFLQPFKNESETVSEVLKILEATEQVLNDERYSSYYLTFKGQSGDFNEKFEELVEDVMMKAETKAVVNLVENNFYGTKTALTSQGNSNEGSEKKDCSNDTLLQKHLEKSDDVIMDKELLVENDGKRADEIEISEEASPDDTELSSRVDKNNTNGNKHNDVICSEEKNDHAASKEKIDKKQRFVRVRTKILPRYRGENLKENELFPTEKLQDFFSNSITNSKIPEKLLRVRSYPCKTDPFSLQLRIVGREDLVEKVKGSLHGYVNGSMQSYNLSRLNNDPKSFVVKIYLDSDKRIGAQVWDTAETLKYVGNGAVDTGGAPGVWIVTTSIEDNESELRNICGKAVQQGACILKIGDYDVRSMAQIVDAQSKYKKEEIKMMPVTLCLSSEANVNCIDTNRIVKEKCGDSDDALPVIRRNDGSIYYGAPFKFEIDTTQDRNKNSHVERRSSATKKTTMIMAQPCATKDQTKSTLTKRASVTASTKPKSFYPTQMPSSLSSSSSSLKSSHRNSDIAQTPVLDTPFKRFAHKILPIYNIEYKERGIKFAIVSRSLWIKHKQIYSTNCPEDCKCLSDLPKLCTNVIKDVMEKQPSFVMNASGEVGFARNFVPKFYQRVKDALPGKSPTDVIEKLTEMWEIHREEAGLGLRCRKDCDCEKRWNLLFSGHTPVNKSDEKETSKPQSSRGGVGNKSLSSKTISAVAEKKSARPTISFVNDPIALSTLKTSERNQIKPSHLVRQRSTEASAAKKSDPLSARRAFIPGKDPLTMIQPSSTSSSARYNNQLKEKLTPMKSVVSTASQKSKEYTMLFKTFEALGFFTITEKRKDNTTICKILSVSPQGQKTHPRLKAGTIILASAIIEGTITVNTRSNLTSHLMLRQRYDAARKRQGRKLRLWFIDTDDCTTSNEEDWDNTGMWQGTESLGWAGGAAVAPPKKKWDNSGRIVTKAHLMEREEDEMKNEDCSKESQVTDLQHSNDKNESVTVLNEDKCQSNKPGPVLGGGNPPGPSLLRRSSSNVNKSRRVSFSNNISQVRQYIKDSVDQTEVETKRTIAKDKSKKDAQSTMKEHSGSNRNECMTDAIMNHDYKKVISLLQSGIYVKQKDSKGRRPWEVVEEIYERTKRELNEANTSTSTTMSVAEKNRMKNENNLKLKDIALVRKVLKVYLHIEILIDSARYVDSWSTVDLSVKKLKGLKLTPLGRQKQCPEFLFCRVRFDTKHQSPDMPPVPFGEFIDFTNIAHFPTYLCRYNDETEFTYKDRMVSIDLYKGMPLDYHMKLGTWSIALEGIKEGIGRDSEMEFEQEGIMTDFLEDQARITLVLKKIKGDENFSKLKKYEAAKGISDVLDWIVNFRKETGDDSLSANIMVPISGNVSLLHAAIFLEDVNLVKRVLSLDANPLMESEVGTALSLAKSLKENNQSETSEKIYNMIHMASNPNLNNQVFGNTISTKEDKALPSRGVHDSQEQFLPNLTAKRSYDGYENERDQNPSMNDNRDRKRPKRSFDDTPSFTESHDKSVQKQSTVDNTGHLPNNGNRVKLSTSNKQMCYEDVSRPINELANEVERVLQERKNAYCNLGNPPIIQNPHWAEIENVGRCFHFKRQTCVFGKACKKNHVQNPLGPILDTYKQEEILNNDHILEKTELSSSDALNVWYTAAYRSPDENILYYAERGVGGVETSQQLYWYLSKELAKSALRRVVHAARHDPRALVSNEMHAEGEIGNKRLQLGGNDQPVKKQKTGKEQYYNRINEKSNRGLLQEAIANNWNLSNIYCKIFSGFPLKKAGWKSESAKIKGKVLFTVTLSSPNEKNVKYVPWGDGGTFHDGRYWYKDEKVAKAAAFINCLRTLAEAGKIKDLRHTLDGRELLC